MGSIWLTAAAISPHLMGGVVVRGPGMIKATQERKMKTLVALAFVAGMTAYGSEAYATWDYLGSQCGGSYTYLKGDKASWPGWAQQDGCVRGWSENPMANPKPHRVKH